MQRKSFEGMQCPIARSLERVGEWWSILILRDAFLGLTRFDQFQKSLGIAPNMLARRLAGLVESGLLERRPYSERPKREEYVLTGRGRDFQPVLWAILAWGNRQFAPEGASVIVVDSKSGAPADPVLIDGISGRRLESGATPCRRQSCERRCTATRNRTSRTHARKTVRQAGWPRRPRGGRHRQCCLVWPWLVDNRPLHPVDG
jgi:DNA-binding HxlR family transcriptional regulator